MNAGAQSSAGTGRPFWLDRDEDVLARERSALALREVVAQLVQADAPASAFQAAADTLEELAASLRVWPVRRSTPPRTSGYLGHRALLLPAVEYGAEPDVFVVRTRLGIGYEGPPGRLHGGMVAYLFDCCFGQAFGHFGIESSFTGTMTVRYLAATPLDAALTVSTVLDRREGRKSFLSSTMTADGTPTATAEVVMITPRPPAGDTGR